MPPSLTRRIHALRARCCMRWRDSRRSECHPRSLLVSMNCARTRVTTTSGRRTSSTCSTQVSSKSSRPGMPGVFFGGAIVGSNLPQLTYMVVHPELEDTKKNWRTFGQDPEWKKLISNPGFKDNVSRVTALFIRPAAGSQI